MANAPITAPSAAEILTQLYAAQTTLAEVRTYLGHQAAMESALRRVDLGRPALLELVDTTCRATARTLVRMEIPDQPADAATVTVDALAELLSDADVHINGGDYPTWGDLAESGQDQYRQAATYLLARCSVATRPVPA